MVSKIYGDLIALGQLVKKTITLKMANQGRCDFCVVFTTSVHVLEIETNVDKFAISSHTAFNLDKQALRRYLKLTCEYELHILPNRKIMVKAT